MEEGTGPPFFPGCWAEAGLAGAEAALGDCRPGQIWGPRGRPPRGGQADRDRRREASEAPGRGRGEARGPQGARAWKAHGLRGWGSFTWSAAGSPSPRGEASRSPDAGMKRRERRGGGLCAQTLPSCGKEPEG